MKPACRLLLPLLALLCAALPARAQSAINLDGAFLWGAGDRLFIQAAEVTGHGNFDAGFQWDAASSSFRLIPDTTVASNMVGMPGCPTMMRFVETAGSTRIYLGANLNVDTWARTMQLTLAYLPSSDTTATNPDFAFRPTRLRLVQSGRIYTLGDISSTANPHFIPDNGWLPNIEPISPLAGQVSARIVDFPVDFDLTRAFYVFYGSGTPSAPMSDGNDTYYYCPRSQ